jgi:ABC-type branched-subunit amino acid transport system substrate-binding protein
MVKTRAFAVLCVAVVLLAGCGTRNKDEAASNAGSSGNAGNAPVNTGTAAPGGSTDANTFGTLPNPCGPNEAGGTNGDSDKGVTADEIVVTTIADPGGAKPGLDQGMLDSMVAFGDWCNSFGGINGRKLKVVTRDAKIFEYGARVAEACDDSFALVGGLGVLDSVGAQPAIDCGLVNVPGAAVSAEQTMADRTYQPLPNPINSLQVGSGKWIASKFPDAPPKAANVYSSVPAVEIQSQRQVEAYTQIGYNFVVHEPANVNETNWGPIVVKLKDADAKYLSATSSFEELVPLLKEMGNQGFAPEVIELETNFYNNKFPEQAKEASANIDNTYVRLTTWPFEEAAERPAMQSYLDILGKYVPAGVPEQLGVQSFSAGLLFATAAKAAGNDLTRDNLLTQLKNIHEWDGGGLHGVSDPGNNKPATCFVAMKVSYEGFTRQYPLPDADKAVYDAGNGMACPTDATVQLTGNYGTGAKEKK